MQQMSEFLAKAMPKEWFTESPEVRCDREEMVVVGRLPEGVDPIEFRENTRPARMGIASLAEAKFGRKVSWGVRQEGDEVLLFTHLNVPVMTRLRIDDRAVLDALIEGGLARSRSEALAWCVRRVGEQQKDWLDELRAAADHVRKVREKGPC
ncbi:MAG TPA: hypothetical protein VGO03_18400 [Acidimicrobiia bacterium]|jgi:hypothetical protein